MHNYQLIIFDWDGTLMDSTGSIVECIEKSIDDLNLPKIEKHKIQNIIGLGLKEAVLGLYPAADENLIYDLSATYRKHFFKTKQDRDFLFPNVIKMLDELKDNNFTLAVATGKGRQGLDKVLTETKLVDYFVATRAADETASKPHPKMLHEIVEQTGINYAKTLMIGDTEYDLEMAANANVDAVAVSTGAHSKDRLLNLNPKYHIEDIGQITALLGL